MSPRHVTHGVPACSLRVTLVAVHLAEAATDQDDATGLCVVSSSLYPSNTLWLLVTCRGHASRRVLLTPGLRLPRRVLPVFTGVGRHVTHTQHKGVKHTNYKVDYGVVNNVASDGGALHIFLTRFRHNLMIMKAKLVSAQRGGAPNSTSTAHRQAWQSIPDEDMLLNHLPRLLADERLVRRTTRAERIWEYDAVCGLRIASSETTRLKERTRSLNGEAPEAMVHGNTYRWRSCLACVCCVLLIATCFIGTVEWSRSHVIQRLIARLHKDWPRGLEATNVQRRFVDVCLLLLTFLQCWTWQFDAGLLITALAILCCTLLHLLLSLVLLGVRPARHALSYLEERLVPLLSFNLRVATLLWRALVTAIIICIFAVVAANMC